LVVLWLWIPMAKRQAFLLVVAAALGGLTLLLPGGVLRYAVAFLLLWVLPGLAWLPLLGRGALDRLERTAIALGLSFVVSPVVTLLLSYLSGPVAGPALVFALLGCVGVPLLVSGLRGIRRDSDGGEAGQALGGKGLRHAGPGRAGTALRVAWRSGWALFAIAIVIAAALRLTHLGYSEFQGDEAAVLVRAAEALEGNEEAVFGHKKGPAELTVVMASWRLAGVTNEWMARLPFSWSSLLGLVAVFLVCRRLGQPIAGGIAVCVLGINGYFVGFGRIVQYQSLVFALSSLGLLCSLAYADSGRSSVLATGAAFFAGGLLAHYDGLLVLPAAAIPVAGWLRRDGRGRGRTLAATGVALSVAVAVLGVFYLPFVLGPYVGHTSSYLAGRIGGDSLFVNNLRSSFELSLLYNAIYLLGLIAASWTGLTLATWRRWGRVGTAAGGCLIAAAAAAAVWPELFAVGGISLAWLPVACLLVGACAAPGLKTGMRAVWTWLAVPALIYLFVVAQPLTHVHTLFPALSILCGVALAGLGRALAPRSRPALAVACAAGLAVYAICGFYASMLFVDHTPEYVRTYPASRNPLYWTPYDCLPEEGLFGFPYRAGWKAVGYLVDDGWLSGSYDSNEEPDVTDYYTRRSLRLSCASPDYYVIARNVQDEVEVRWDEVGVSYRQLATVTVNGDPKIAIRTRYDPIVCALCPPEAVHAVEEYELLFDQGTTPDRVANPASPVLSPGAGGDYIGSGAVLGDVARLLQYRIDARNAIPGGYVEVVLVWEPLEPTSIDYHVFTHLHDGLEMWGQLDGQPVCGNMPTSQWQPGQLVLDAYRIPIRGNSPAVPVALDVGMYDFETMERLPILAADGTAIGDSVYLGEVLIRAP
jgi:hypothetical protein